MASNNSFFRRRRKPLIWLFALVFVYTIVGFFVLPAVIKSQMLKQLPQITKRRASVAEVKINPYALSLTIRGLKLAENNGDIFASLGEFYGNFELSSIVRGKFVFSELTIKEPSATIIWNADGTFNFANILETPANAPAKPTEKTTIPKILIEKFSVEEGGIDFADFTRKQPFRTKIGPLHLNLKDFTTQPNTRNPYSFTASTDAKEEFAWAGDITVDPLASSGTFKLSGIDLKKYGPYINEFAKIEIKDGKVEVGADYDLTLANGLGLTVQKVAVKLTALQVEDSSNAEKIVSLPFLEVLDGEASLQKRSARIGGIKIADGAISLRRGPDGKLNLLSLLTLPKNDVAPAQTVTTNAPWAAAIEEFSITNFAINAEDKVPEHPANIALNHLSVTLKNLTWPPRTPVRLAFATKVGESGKLSARGDVNLDSLEAAVNVDVSGFALRTVQPYVEPFAKVAITSGTVNSTLQVKFSKSGSPMLKVKGEVEVQSFATVDGIVFQDLAKFQSLKISGIDADLLPNRFHVDEIALGGLSTSVIITSNKQPNVLAILPPKPEATNAPSETATKISVVSGEPLLPFPVELGKFALEHASFHFADHSIEPHCSFDVEDFSGSVKGLSSENKNPADIDINGRVDERSTFGIAGKLGPLATNMIVDLHIACTNTGLTAFTPYMEKFAGYPLKKGNLSVGLKYEIAGKQLKAENKVEINQLTLGARNNSSDATKLPVKLGIALLKDREGKIQLDVPLSGTIGDPQFRIGPIVLQVVVNILTKAATSPFTLLGALFGGGEEMSYVDFAPGRFDISEGEAAKLEKLAKSLYERPELELEINGSADLIRDRPALAKYKLEQQIKSLRVKELVEAGSAPQNVEGLAIEKGDYDRLVSTLFGKQFGSNTITTAVVAVTNGISSTQTNVAAVPVVANAVAKPRIAVSRGAEFLIARSTVEKVERKIIPAAAAESSKTEIAPVASVVSTNQVAQGPTLEEMESRLISQIAVTDDDLRDLMVARAKKVQGVLLNSGKVGAERLFLLSPKKFDETFKGELRVNLSLN